MRLRLLILAVALAMPAPAAADTTVVPAPDSYGLSADGGWMVWSERTTGGRWQLVTRAPNGSVTRPQVPTFASAPTLSTGTIRPEPPAFRVVATYGRDDGDAWQLDLATGRETKLTAISSRSYRETAISIAGRNIVFARAGGSKNGLYVRTPSGTRRLDSRVPRFTANNGSRVAYSRGDTVVVRRISGDGAVYVLRNAGGSPRSIVLTRYRVSWLGQGGRVFQTPRFGGSGRREVRPAVESTRQLPASTNSIALERDRVSLILDGEGVKRLAPRPFPNG